MCPHRTGWAAAYATGVVPVDLPPPTGPATVLGDKHLNMHGLPFTDPLNVDVALVISDESTVAH